MTVIGALPPPKVYHTEDGRIAVEGNGFWGNHYSAPNSPLGRALLELIERRAADIVGVAADPAGPDPIHETPLRELVGYANDARADIAEAVAQCATQDAAEALTQALAYMNAVVRLCVVAAVRDAS